MTVLGIATINIRNLMDRWEERLPLLLADFAALQPDVCAMQEVVYPLQQDRLLAAAGAAHYTIHRGFAQRPEWGNSLLIRDHLDVGLPARVDLGHGRAANRAIVTTTDGASLTVVAVHLHHLGPDAAIREQQAAELVAWLGAGPATDGFAVMGDFNAPPAEPAYAQMVAAGFRSAHAEANGGEPEVTWPSGLIAPGMDTDGSPACLDYIWLRGSAIAEACRLAFDRPAAGDRTLYPSDHVGLHASIRLGR